MTVTTDEERYFAGQVSKSDRKIAVQYGRIFALAGLRGRLPDGPVLDVGCGAGPVLRYLASRDRPVFGIDASLYALRQASALVQARGLAQADVRLALPFRDGTFGLVVASEVIEHLPDGRPFLEECRRILRPGGRVLLTTPNLWDVRRLTAALLGKTWSAHTDPTHVNLYTPRRLARELAQAGFKGLRVRTGFKPLAWLPPWRSPIPVPYPPLVGNGLLGTGAR